MQDSRKHIGIDSVLLKQEYASRGNTFTRKGLIGIGLEVSNPEKFGKNYEKCFSKLMVEEGIESQRPFYCAWDLKEMLGLRNDIHQEIKILEKIKQDTLGLVDCVHFFYTYIFHFKEISVFGSTKHYRKIPLASNNEGTQDFYDLIASAYPIYCAWKLQNDGMIPEIHSDNFQGRKCPAWFLLDKQRLKIFYQGDRCNPLISAADIYTRLMKLRMVENKHCYLENEVDSLLKKEFKNNAKKHFLGSKYLKELSPNETQRIKTGKNISHPIYFISKENPDDEAETMTIEQSPKFNEALKEIVQKGGCFKYYEKGNDCNLIKKGDKFIPFGEKGKKELMLLEAGKYPITEFK